MTAVVSPPILDVWATLMYRGYCECATCGDLAHCRGVNPTIRVCITCLEFEHDCVPPRRRRQP